MSNDSEFQLLLDKLNSLCVWEERKADWIKLLPLNSHKVILIPSLAWVEVIGRLREVSRINPVDTSDLLMRGRLGTLDSTILLSDAFFHPIRHFISRYKIGYSEEPASVMEIFDKIANLSVALESEK